MTRQDLGINKFATLLTGNERDFAAWCFQKLMGLNTDRDQIKQKKTADSIHLYLIRAAGFLPLALSSDRYGKLKAEYLLAVAKEKSRPTYEQLELMLSRPKRDDCMQSFRIGCWKGTE